MIRAAMGPARTVLRSTTRTWWNGRPSATATPASTARPVAARVTCFGHLDAALRRRMMTRTRRTTAAAMTAVVEGMAVEVLMIWPEKF